MNFKVFYVLCFIALSNLHIGNSFSFFEKCPEINTISDFNAEKYMGVWYEIMRLPVSFEDGKKCIQAEYSIIDASTFKVNNSAVDIKTNKFSYTIGKGIIKDPNARNKIIVEFNVGPWGLIKTSGGYNVIDTDYASYSLIYSCRMFIGLFKREYAWILSRTPTQDINQTNNLKDKLKNYVSDINEMINADRSNC